MRRKRQRKDLPSRQIDANYVSRNHSSVDSNDEQSEAEEEASDEASDDESLLEVSVIKEMEDESEDEDGVAAKASAFGLKTANELGDDAPIPDTNGIEIPEDVILDRLGQVHEIVNQRSHYQSIHTRRILSSIRRGQCGPHG